MSQRGRCWRLQREEFFFFLARFGDNNYIYKSVQILPLSLKHQYLLKHAAPRHRFEPMKCFNSQEQNVLVIVSYSHMGAHSHRPSPNTCSCPTCGPSAGTSSGWRPSTATAAEASPRPASTTSPAKVTTSQHCSFPSESHCG